jgi:membrane-associated phospholipid phosphatase
MDLPEIDKLIFFAVNRDMQNSIFDIIMPFITSKSYLVFLPFFLLLLFKEKKNAGIALMLGIASLLLSDWTSNILKHYFGRIRPCNALEGVRMLVGCGKSFSMPSGHAVNAFSFMTPFLFMVRSRLKYIFPVIAVLVAFSRMYVGVHYPSDVLAGGLLGSFLAVCMIVFYKKTAERSNDRPESTILFVFLLAISLFRIYYILNSPLDLSPDEAHYWEWARRPDLSYYSKGPMIAYLIYIGTAIFGDTVFGIRFMAVIFSLLSSLFLFILGKNFADERTGLFSAIVLQIIPLFSAFGILFTIDSPFIFFWILSLFLFWKALCKNAVSDLSPAETHQTGGIIYWMFLGVSIGLGLLTKYTMAFFYLSAFLFFLFARGQKKFLFTKGPYIAFLTSLLIFSPVIIWNMQHDWVTFRHTAGQAHIAAGFQISLDSFAEFIGSQFGVITPLLLMLMVPSLRRLRTKREGAFLFWFAVPVIAFFLLKSIQGKVQANWAMPGYITGIVAFSAVYLNEFTLFGKGKKILVSAAVLLSLATTAVAHYPAVLNLPPDLDPVSRLYGWKDLGSEVTQTYEQMADAGRPVFIFSDRYQISSELAFYVKGHPVTYCVNRGRRMNQYDLWPGFDRFLHADAIFVTSGDSKIPGYLTGAFREVEKKVFTVYTKKHVKIRDYSLMLCYDFNGLSDKQPETY